MAVSIVCAKVHPLCAWTHQDSNDVNGIKAYMDHLDKDHTHASLRPGSWSKDAIA